MNRKPHKDAISLLKRLIREQVMSYYTKEGEKNVKKYEKLKKPEKERMAKDSGFRESFDNEKKQEIIKDLLELAQNYNNGTVTREELIEELGKLGKHVGSSKAIVEKNIHTIPEGRKVYVFELAQLFQDEPSEKSDTITDHIPAVKETSKKFWAKDANKEFKKTPEKAKSVSEKDREEEVEETKETKKVKDSMGKTEAAPSTPKGVKKMKEEKPTKFKSFLTGKGGKKLDESKAVKKKLIENHLEEIEVDDYNLDTETGMTDDPGVYPSGGGGSALPSTQTYSVVGHVDLTLDKEDMNRDPDEIFDLIYTTIVNVVRKEFGRDASNQIDIQTQKISADKFRVQVASQPYERD